MKKITIVTGYLEGDPHLPMSAASILPQLKSGKATWLIKSSSPDVSEPLRQLSQTVGVKIVAEADSSLYHGLNQALEHVEDPYFMVLGAGDTLAPDSVEFMHTMIHSNPAVDGFYFAISMAKTGHVLLPRPSELGHRMACPHPGAVLSTEKVRNLGGFDERYRIAADYDLLCRYVAAHGASGWSDRVVVNYLGGGMSEVRAIEGFLEEELIRLRVCKSPQIDVCLRGVRFFDNVGGQLRSLGLG